VTHLTSSLPLSPSFARRTPPLAFLALCRSRGLLGAAWSIDLVAKLSSLKNALFAKGGTYLLISLLSYLPLTTRVQWSQLSTETALATRGNTKYRKQLKDPNMKTRFSRRTLASLAKSIDLVFSHSELSVLAYESGEEDHATGPNKLQRALGLIQAIEADKRLGHKRIQTVIESILDSCGEHQFEFSPIILGLRASLNLDGMEFRAGALVPTTPQPAQLAPQISLLESNLKSASLGIAARHYGQAADNFASGNFEAANGQLRSFLEDLFIQICMKKTGRESKHPTSALQKLHQSGYLEEAEWRFLKEHWAACQSNGPHSGLTERSEALFRFHVATAIARYLLAK